MQYLNEIEVAGRRVEFINIMIILMFVSIVISLFYLIWMRSHLLKYDMQIDEDAFTPSDFCLMGVNMRFDDYSPEGIEKEIRERFKTNYGIDDIEYVNAAYDIDNFY